VVTRPARRACDWEQGEWAGETDSLFGLVAAATMRSGNARQVRSRHPVTGGETDGGSLLSEQVCSKSRTLKERGTESGV
jgi:hypothetical protein